MAPEPGPTAKAESDLGPGPGRGPQTPPPSLMGGPGTPAQHRAWEAGPTPLTGRGPACLAPASPPGPSGPSNPRGGDCPRPQRRQVAPASLEPRALAFQSPLKLPGVKSGAQGGSGGGAGTGAPPPPALAQMVPDLPGHRPVTEACRPSRRGCRGFSIEGLLCGGTEGRGDPTGPKPGPAVGRQSGGALRGKGLSPAGRGCRGQRGSSRCRSPREGVGRKPAPGGGQQTDTDVVGDPLDTALAADPSEASSAWERPGPKRARQRLLKEDVGGSRSVPGAQGGGRPGIQEAGRSPPLPPGAARAGPEVPGPEPGLPRGLRRDPAGEQPPLPPPPASWPEGPEPSGMSRLREPVNSGPPSQEHLYSLPLQPNKVVATAGGLPAEEGPQLLAVEGSRYELVLSPVSWSRKPSDGRLGESRIQAFG
ncbi:proline-rich proteoglycan 2-like [Sarcophilus harrisii]|uniref:proline-rich proteoglycan 2-like n=1 Tax=Sarcophilus harrisii TaxID=9305 RepID=UPI001301E484|nr:proline-rich proteoglycan 2-like [Sarcophilus harrisii]